MEETVVLVEHTSSITRVDQGKDTTPMPRHHATSKLAHDRFYWIVRQGRHKSPETALRGSDCMKWVVQSSRGATSICGAF